MLVDSFTYACAVEHERSEINAIISEANAFLKRHHFPLPPFAFWTPEEWAEKGTEVGQIVRRRLGWDMGTRFWLGRGRR